MRKFELEAVNMLAPSRKYPGAFGLNIDWIIRQLVDGNDRVLHLFSGDSKIGQERVDIENKNATTNCEVGEFCKRDNRDWDWIVLDPPYAIAVKTADAKLDGYGIKRDLSANVGLRRVVTQYLQRHTHSVLWLDLCAPMIKGFYRQKLWLVLPGAFHQVRVLSWLKREMKPLL